MKGIESVLGKENYELYVEYMDTKRIEDTNYINKLHDIYQYKFGKKSFDIIIVSDDNAFNYFKKYKNEIFTKNLPLVFCGVNFFQDADIEGRHDITGVVEDYDIKGTEEDVLIQEIIYTLPRLWELLTPLPSR